MAKYTPLHDHLIALKIKGIKEWRTTYSEIEELIGSSLPSSARNYSAFWKWSKDTIETGGVRRALQAAKWETRNQSATSRTLVFVALP